MTKYQAEAVVALIRALSESERPKSESEREVVRGPNGKFAGSRNKGRPRRAIETTILRSNQPDGPAVTGDGD